MFDILVIILFLFIIIICIYINYYKKNKQSNENFSISTQNECKPDIIGTIKIFASKDNIPDGYKLCNGQILDKNIYKKLYNVIGDIYIQRQLESKFYLPDLRDKFVLGSNVNYLGITNGSDIISLNKSNMPAHEHFMFNSSDGERSLIEAGERIYKKDRDKYIYQNNYIDFDGIVGLQNDDGRSYHISLGGALPTYGKTSVGYPDTRYSSNNAPGFNIKNPNIKLNYIIFTGVYDKDL
jgi:microcystin-dependent protein